MNMVIYVMSTPVFIQRQFRLLALFTSILLMRRFTQVNTYFGSLGKYPWIIALYFSSFNLQQPCIFFL